MLADLSEDAEAARRIAFTLAKMGSKLGLPYPSSADLLLQAAMERPEAVTPEEFKVAYLMRPTAAGIA
jgi:hypothetical protein